MAKVTFLQGKARGKVGGIVYRTEAGIGTIASEYNPSPRNPRTLAQVEQRSKMNVCGRISKITPYPVIAGMASNKRQARSLFLSNLLKNAQVFESTPNMQVRGVDVVLSQGVPVPANASLAVETATNVVTVNASYPNTNETVLGSLVVVYVSKDGDNVYCLYDKVDGSTVNKTFDLSALAADASTMAVQAFLVPIIDTGEGVRAAYDELYMSAANFNASAIRTLVSGGAYAASQFVDARSWDIA